MDQSWALKGLDFTRAPVSPNLVLQQQGLEGLLGNGRASGRNGNPRDGDYQWHVLQKNKCTGTLGVDTNRKEPIGSISYDLDTNTKLKYRRELDRGAMFIEKKSQTPLGKVYTETGYQRERGRGSWFLYVLFGG